MCFFRSVVDNFYPRPPRGGRPTTETVISSISNFYPRPPRGGRQRPRHRRAGRKRFLSTPSARRATKRAADILRNA